METVRYFCIACIVCLLSSTASFADDAMPDYILKAQTVIAQANAKAAGLNNFSDAVLIGQNYLRRAETEYKKNQSWGKLDPKVESTVRYYADMARLQASIVLSQVGTIEQEKEQLRLEALIVEVKTKIKVFEDKNSAVTALKGELVKRDAAITELNATSGKQKNQIEAMQQEMERLSSKIASLSADLSVKTAALAAGDIKIAAGLQELKAKQQALEAAEQKNAEMTKNLDLSRGEAARLRGDLAVMAAQKGAADSQSQEQIQALKRSQDFVAEVGKLGGVIKAGSDNMTVIFIRSFLLKSPKNELLTPEGAKALQRIAELLKKYQEFRVKLTVHGFGQPAKSENAAATARMARLIREALVENGTLDPASVEAVGTGYGEPIYLKNNPEGNRRVEVTFVKK